MIASQTIGEIAPAREEPVHVAYPDNQETRVMAREAEEAAFGIDLSTHGMSRQIVSKRGIMNGVHLFERNISNPCVTTDGTQMTIDNKRVIFDTKEPFHFHPSYPWGKSCAIIRKSSAEGDASYFITHCGRDRTGNRSETHLKLSLSTADPTGKGEPTSPYYSAMFEGI